MERVQVLIDKLIQQRQQNESPAQLLLTVQLLQNELLQLQQKNGAPASAKVAVVLPAGRFAAREEVAVKVAETPVYPPAPVEEKRAAPVVEVEVVQQQPAPQPEEAQKDLFGSDVYALRRPAFPLHEEVKAPEVKREERPEEKSYFNLDPVEPAYHPFDVVAETPTLVQHTPAPKDAGSKEINQVINHLQPSLNDRLKQDKVELAHVLTGTPIKDLRKAIGINDKFLFVDELFRGDEAMYERSIKTINSFHIFQEAEYWINRELKLRLGWDEDRATVQHFYQLVKRRFS